MTLWQVRCLENRFPGMWQRWFRHQAVGIGWPPKSGFHLHGKTKGGQGWSRARNALQAVQPGDWIVVTLQGHRIGRLGEVTGKTVGDDEWTPLVAPSRDYEHGEMGRRLEVRWDLTAGPDDRDLVVQLPPGERLTSGELRPTIAQVKSRSLADLKKSMGHEQNWDPLFRHFDYERALSGYIAAYPHRLEDGFLPHPNDKVRERVFKDRKRLDVLLTDRNEVPVVVECKQGAPTTDHVQQLRGYMERLHEETGKEPRGILVHGGSRKLSPAVSKEAAKPPAVEIVQYRLELDFSPSA